MNWTIDLKFVKINILENLGWTIGYMIAWFFFLSSNPTLSKAIPQFFVTFLIFVAIDNLFRAVVWLFFKVVDMV